MTSITAVHIPAAQDESCVRCTVTRLVQTDDPALLEPWLDAKCRDDLGVIYVRASLPAFLQREQVRKAIHEARRHAGRRERLRR